MNQVNNNPKKQLFSRMYFWVLSIGIVVFVLFATGQPTFASDGDLIVYAANRNAEIFEVNLSLGSSQQVGTLAFGTQAIEQDPDTGRVYYFEDNSASSSRRLAYWDPDTGTNTIVQTYSLSSSFLGNRMAINPNGYIFLANDAGWVYRIDKQSGSMVTLGPTSGVNTGGPGTGDIAFTPAGVPYLVTYRNLFQISFSLQATEMYSNMLTGSSPGLVWTGLAYCEGILYASHFEGDASLTNGSSAMFSIDPGTGSVVELFDLPVSVDDLTSCPAFPSSNTRPTANDQTVNTDENTAVSIILTGSDADSDTLTYAIVNGPANGVLSGSAPNLTYTPNTDFFGADSFTFQSSDGAANSSLATVSIDVIEFVNSAPVADAQSVTMDENTAVSITLTASDADGHPLTYSVVDAPANGSLSGTVPNLTYTPNTDYVGADSFTFRANDGEADSNLATVAITVNSTNTAPVANAQSVSTDENTAVSITLTASDADGDALTYSVVDSPANGSLSGTAPNLTYTPNTDYVGADSFTFKVNDGEVDSNVATVSIAVNGVNATPVANAQSISMDENTAVSITLTGSDADGDALTYSVVDSPANGSLSGIAPNLTYTPSPDFVGNDSFTFKVNDGFVDSNVATVSITVNNVNMPPVANSQSVSTDENTAVSITLTASDADGDALTYSVVDAPANGSLSGTAPNLTYTPNIDFVGADSFTFEVNDGAADSNLATVSITVNSVNNVIVYSSNRDDGEVMEINLTQGTAQVIGTTSFGTVAVEQDPTTGFIYYYERFTTGDEFAYYDPATDTNTVVRTYNPAPGFFVKRMAFHPNGTLYMMDNNETLYRIDKTNGDFTFVGQINGLVSGSLNGTGDIAFAPDGTFYLATYGNLYTISNTLQPTLLYADMLPINDDIVTWSGLAYCDGLLYASHVESDAAQTYANSSMYSLNPNTGAVNELFALPTYANDLTSCLTGFSLNNAPVANAQSVATDENAALAITLTSSDADADILTYEIVGQPANGSLSGTAPNLTYTPNTDYVGADSFTFQVSDGAANSNVATISITVNSLNTAPVANAQSVSTDENTAVSITLTAGDVDGDALTYSVESSPANGSLSGTAPNLTYTPNTDYAGVDSFTFRVNDGEADSNVATISITVNDVNEPPVANNQLVNTDENTAVSITLTASDADGDALTYAVTNAPVNGSLSGTAPNLTYTPNTDYVGNDSFIFQANDGASVSNSAVVSITVTAVNTPPIADDQAVITDENTAVAIVLTGSDADGDALTYNVVTPPANGSLSGIAPNLTYTPNTDFAGSDSFTFQANDGTDNSNTATVSISVVGQDDTIIYASNRNGDLFAVNLTLNVSYQVGTLAFGTQAMEQDPVTGYVYYFEEKSVGNGDQFAYWDPATGTNTVVRTYNPIPSFYAKRLAFHPDGTLYLMDDDENVYEVDKQTGDYTFVNHVSGINTGWITGTGDNAFAPDGTFYIATYRNLYSVDSNWQATELYTDLLVGEAYRLVWTGLAYCDGLLYGSHFEGDQALTYGFSNMYSIDPATGNVNELFTLPTYVNDLTSCAEVPPTNTAPVADDQSVSVGENTAVSITLTSSDADGDALTYSVVGSPTNGSLSGTVPNLTYTPNTDYVGADSFTFQVNDGSVDSNVATVSVTVNAGANTPPVADNQSVVTNENTPVAITLTGSDADGDPLSYIATVCSTDTVRIMPLGDSITVGHSSGVYDSDKQVSYRRDLWNSLIAGGYNVDFVGSQMNGHFFSNFDYQHEGHSGWRDDQIAYNIYNNGGSNWLTSTPADVILLHIGTNEVDTDPSNVESILNEIDEYETDNNVEITVILARIVNRSVYNATTTQFNDNVEAMALARIANGDKIVLVDMEDGAGINYAIQPTGDMWDNLHPFETGYSKMADVWMGALVNVLASNCAGIVPPSHGTLSGTAPNLTYTPNPGFTGTDSFTFYVNDGTADSNIATVSVTVNPVNDPPVADDQSINTNENTPVAITLTGSDVDGDALTYSVVDAPANGSLSGTVPNLTYTPNTDFTGADSFTFKVNDGEFDSGNATVSITVVAEANNIPVANAQSVATDEDVPVAITLTGTDADGDALTYSVVNGPTNGSLSGTAPNLTYTPDNGFTGSDSITFKVNDGEVDSATATVSITVNNVDYLTVYGSNRDSELVEINLTLGTSQVIGTLAFGTEAIEQDSQTGYIYYFEQSTSGDQFAYFDPATGTNTIVRSYNPSPGIYVKRMAKHPFNGNMYMVDDNEIVYIINLSNGNITTLGQMNGLPTGPLNGTGDFSFNSSNGTPYLVTYDSLYRVSNALQPTLLYSNMLPQTNDIVSWSGLADCNGLLYASHIESDSAQTSISSSMFSINPNNGQVVELFALTTYVDDLTACSIK